MRLVDAAKMFDRAQVYDAYTNATLFKCQLVSAVSGSSAMANSDRAFSVVPGTTIPARRALKIFDDYWIVGDTNVDEYLGTKIRENYHIERSKGLLTAYTPAQACLTTGGTAFHANKEYASAVTDPLLDAGSDNFWNILFAPGEPVSVGTFFKDAVSKLYRVRQVYLDQSGFNLAQTDELDAGAAQAATFTTNGAYTASTDSYATVSVATSVIQLDYVKFYKYRTQEEAEVKAGDIAVFVAASALTPKVGATFTMLSKTWRVVSVVSEADAWVLHVRLA